MPYLRNKDEAAIRSQLGEEINGVRVMALTAFYVAAFFTGFLLARGMLLEFIMGILLIAMAALCILSAVSRFGTRSGFDP